jgi:hypothetical protein
MSGDTNNNKSAYKKINIDFRDNGVKVKAPSGSEWWYKAKALQVVEEPSLCLFPATTWQEIKTSFRSLCLSSATTWQEIKRIFWSLFLSPRWYSTFPAVLQYVTIPIFTIEVSLLLILESANVLDCIKDTIVRDMCTKLHARTRSCVVIL